MKRKHIPPVKPVETGVSVIDRKDVEKVDSGAEYKKVIKNAINIFDFNMHAKKKDPFNIHSDNRYPKLDPLELMLPAGTNPHESILKLAKPVVEEYGYFVASVDSAKATLSNRANDLAIKEIQALTKSRPVGFAFLVLRHEDRCRHDIRGLVEIMDELDAFEEPIVIQGEGSHAPRLERLRESIGQLAVPTISIVTMAASEKVMPMEPEQQQIDPGPGLSTLG